MDLSITIDRLKVIAGPETIKLRTSVGGTGQRGSLWLAGAGKKKKKKKSIKLG